MEKKFYIPVNALLFKQRDGYTKTFFLIKQKKIFTYLQTHFYLNKKIEKICC